VLRPSHGSKRAELGLVAVTAIWGMSFPIIRYTMTSGWTPLTLIALRFIIASIALAPFALRGTLKTLRTLAGKGVLLGVLMGLGFLTQTIGLETTSAANSAFITGMSVVFVPFFDRILRNTRIRMHSVLGALLAVLGLFFLTGVASSAGTDAINRGDLYTLACAILWALYMVLLQEELGRFPHLPLIFIQFVVVAAGTSIAGLALEGLHAETGLISTAGLLYLAIPSTALSSWLHFRCQAETTPSRTSVIFTLEPVFAVVFARMTLGETITVPTIAGGALILGGILASEVGTLRT
jgi:drug/metabolite transporter (DMT)-like permease